MRDQIDKQEAVIMKALNVEVTTLEEEEEAIAPIFSQIQARAASREVINSIIDSFLLQQNFVIISF